MADILMTGRSPLPDEPVVTLVVAMRNEADHIGACLRSILAQEYPAERLEILVMDGLSTDRSVEIAEGILADRHLSSVIANPRRIQAAAWNRGVELAQGDIVGIVSGHAELGPGYVRAAVETLARTGADMVGGPVRAIGEGPIGEAVAVAVSTPFGVGGARFRYLETEEDVDTVFMGVCRTETYRAFPFDEEMVRNQDDELSYRILDAGGRIVCNPAIVSSYRSRPTLVSLWKQYFDYGFWKIRVIQKHPGQARLRHVVPAALVVGLGSSAVASRVASAALLLPASYGAAVAIAAVTGSRKGSRRLAATLGVVYPILHVSYGLGFLAGLVRHRRWPAGALGGLVRSLLGRRGQGVGDGPDSSDRRIVT